MGRTAAPGGFVAGWSAVRSELADGGFAAALDAFGAGDAPEDLVGQAGQAGELGDGCAGVELGWGRGFDLGE
jgi:hypothetical protein